jgi:hypothetical protein
MAEVLPAERLILVVGVEVTALLLAPPVVQAL